MDDFNSMAPLGTNGFHGGNSLLDSVIQGIMTPFYAGKWVDAQVRLRHEMIRARSEERKQILETLKAIALKTNDDQMRYQMFQAIVMFGASWQ